MAHFSLQIGAAIVVPISDARRTLVNPGWRARGLREATDAPMPETTWPTPQLRSPREHAYKMRRAFARIAVTEAR
jgi:hypothetical protein